MTARNERGTSKRRRWPVVTGVICASLLVLLLVAYNHYLVDADPPDDSDLLPRPAPVIAAGENGFELVDFDGDEFEGFNSPESGIRELVPFAREHFPGYSWNPDRARARLEQYGDILERAERALERPHFWIPRERLDDEHGAPFLECMRALRRPPFPLDNHDTGAISGLVKPTDNVMDPPGQWNSLLLVCDDNLITVSINGEEVTRMDLDAWTEKGRRPDGTPHELDVACKDLPRAGRIGLEDGGSDVWFKNIKVRPLGPDR